MIIDVSTGDAYHIVAEKIKEITDEPLGTFIINMKTEFYRADHEILTCYPDYNSWDSDWYEGGKTVELLGIISLFDVEVPDLDKGPYKDAIQ